MAATLSITERTRASHLLSAPNRFTRHHRRMNLGDLISAARKRQKLSQRALAAKLGVNPSAVAQWELGSTRPTVDKMSALRSVLDLREDISLSGSAPYPGEVVDDPDELALLRFWRGLNRDERAFMLKRLISSPPFRDDDP